MSIMDTKLPGSSRSESAAESPHSRSKFSLITFLSQMKSEMTKVSWTSKRELLFSTKMVLLSMFVFGFSIYLVDLSIRNLLDMLKAAVHYIAG